MKSTGAGCCFSKRVGTSHSFKKRRHKAVHLLYAGEHRWEQEHVHLNQGAWWPSELTVLGKARAEQCRKSYNATE